MQAVAVLRVPRLPAADKAVLRQRPAHHGLVRLHSVKAQERGPHGAREPVEARVERRQRAHLAHVDLQAGRGPCRMRAGDYEAAGRASGTSSM